MVEEQPSLKQKILSASIGAILTSLTVTPLDVVKVRIQTQTFQTSLKGFPSPTTPYPKITVYNIPHDFYRMAMMRYASSAFIYCSQLFDHVEPYLSVEPQRTKAFTGTLDGIRSIIRNEGITSLWRGLTPTLLMSIPATVVYFVGHDSLKIHIEKLVHQVGDDRFLYVTPGIAGAIARALAATTISPLELMRTRMQSLNFSEEKQAPLKFIIEDYRGMVRQGGITSLWRGLIPTLWRDVPFSAIYWTAYEFTKLSLYQFMQPTHSSKESSFTIPFLAGALSGAFAAFLTTPFDVVKTRRQAESLLNQSSLTHDMTSHHYQQPTTTLPNKRDVQLQKSNARNFIYLNTSLKNCLARIWREEGMNGLFSGVSARIVKVAPACAIMISSYEIGKSILHES